ncbi:peptidase S24/S26A/S26B/S26C [Plectosphaerella cucumerina]|uniref:Peptidase S24/S26A/S26B/S26C n=1 Tax=Plectosphaerella cucumerina TaxID=40658 RepID=A0A8K0TN54_9PEZI|nr:peptidase S24/S26A/S26B/S26C [Plectosphaerella cucumerina]
MSTRRSIPNRSAGQRALLWFIGSAEMLCAAHVFTENICTISSAEGPSMTPTLPATGSWLLINCMHRRGRDIRVGDLVAYRIPIFAHSRGVKRVVGMPGDYVLLETPGGPNPNASMIQVPEGHCWLVGDNLEASRDSRMFGPVPLALVDGKVDATFTSHTPGVGRKWRWVTNPFDEERTIASTSATTSR